MNNVIEKEGKTVAEALQLALDELGVSKEQVNCEIIEETEKKGLFGLFGSKHAKIRVTLLQEQPIDIAKTCLKGIFSNMSLDVLIEEVAHSDSNITLQLHGADLGLLIGKHGQTLDSLQYLVNLVANKNKEEWVRIVLDIENYRQRRTDTLTNLALRLADKVRRRSEKIVLEPMNSHERKIIHMALQDNKYITTYSEGEDPHRHVVIMTKK